MNGWLTVAPLAVSRSLTDLDLSPAWSPCVRCSLFCGRLFSVSKGKGLMRTERENTMR